MIKYKLTDKNMETFGGTRWALGEWKETSGEGGLCSPGWLHCYDSPEIAIFLNPIHASFSNPRLFKCEVDGREKLDNGIRAGYTRMRLTKELNIPKITTETSIRFGILCALKVCKERQFVSWAKKWLSGEDRTRDAAWAAAAIVERASREWAALAAEKAASSKINLIRIAKQAMKEGAK